jgi:hypothetical protein
MLSHTVNANCEVEFRETITRTIPLPTKLLEDKEQDIRCETLRLLGKLAKHGEWQLDGIAHS